MILVWLVPHKIIRYLVSILICVWGGEGEKTRVSAVTLYMRCRNVLKSCLDIAYVPSNFAVCTKTPPDNTQLFLIIMNLMSTQNLVQLLVVRFHSVSGDIYTSKCKTHYYLTYNYQEVLDFEFQNYNVLHFLYKCSLSTWLYRKRYDFSTKVFYFIQYK